ncbi:MAG: transcription elongation factor Spt5 [Candidatus Odinarchaeum yellowstonii]|uniref:Transcription elongation factor Spt5 n=1 Tax=Odinarchaeota yellowstonii (strain LCB_4) TaxID=1841599 RepID=A0AAF0D351_ODILC|nr:MAG: transcription elongation factor Spt5 [Candidatus Odinarchaeum yellowstonii]
MSSKKEKTTIYAVRTIIGQESSVAEIIDTKAKTMGITIPAILYSEALKGYVFIEAKDQEQVDNIITGIPHVRGKSLGKVDIKEIEHVLIKRPPTEGLGVGDTVEIIGGPFKGEKAKVTRIDAAKSEVILELLESTYPIPIKVHADYVKVIEKSGSDNAPEGFE